ncbi:hypothetical protein GL2_06740 [Microbulbifer sp. GL-2]|nr:hypothetical protein GL2_06740 [Microbulbifer sp. GL-2]
MIVIYADQEIGEVPLVFRLHIGDVLLRGQSQLLGLEHDCGAVRVIGANVQAIVAARALKARPDISLDIFEYVAQVQGAIGVRECAGD